MKKYVNPQIALECIDLDDILTSSVTVGVDNVKRLSFGEFDVVEE